MLCVTPPFGRSFSPFCSFDTLSLSDHVLFILSFSSFLLSALFSMFCVTPPFGRSFFPFYSLDTLRLNDHVLFIRSFSSFLLSALFSI